MSLVAFIISIGACILTFAEQLRLVGFAFGIIGLVVSIYAVYQKEKKEKETGAQKETRAIEIGSIILSGAAALVYIIFWITG